MPLTAYRPPQPDAAIVALDEGDPIASTAPRRLPPSFGVGFVAAALVLVALVATSAGEVVIPPHQQIEMVAARLGWVTATAWPATHAAIFFDIRLPRIALAGVAGAALGVAGAAYQGVFRNPLADPMLIGPASGAALGAVLAFVLPLPAGVIGVGAVQFFAFVGALGVAALVVALARVDGATPATTLLLAGAAVGVFATAVTTFLMYRHGDQLFAIYAWLLGGFNVATWHQVRLTVPLVAVALLAAAAFAHPLNLLQLGEERAATLGVEPERVKLVVVAAATLATAAAVAVGGLIGFVGLVVPHVARHLVGPDHRRLLPLAAGVGAAYLVGADAVARSLAGPSEVPVGVVTAFVGAPFFLVLLRRQKRGLRW